jgi:hypothetical protein
MAPGSSPGSLEVFFIFDDSLLFSTISGCSVSSLVAIGLLVVEISLSRLSSPWLHALMRGVRKYVVSEGYVACSKLRALSDLREISNTSIFLSFSHFLRSLARVSEGVS